MQDKGYHLDPDQALSIMPDLGQRLLVEDKSLR